MTLGAAVRQTGWNLAWPALLLLLGAGLGLSLGVSTLGVAGLLAAVRWRLRVSFPPSDLCLLTVLLFTLYIAM